MRDTDLFLLALGLTPPWHVASYEFDPDKNRLDIEIDFPRGSLFTCPICGRVRMPRIRHGAALMAAFELLPA